MGAATDGAAAHIESEKTATPQKRQPAEKKATHVYREQLYRDINRIKREAAGMAGMPQPSQESQRGGSAQRGGGAHSRRASAGYDPYH